MEMKEELTEEQKQFVVECGALKRKIRANKNALRFSIFALVFVWAAVVLDFIRVFTMPGGELTLKHITAQNTLHFQALWAFIYTLWCGYNIPKGEELCQSAMKDFVEKWGYLLEDNKNKEAQNDVPEEETKETVIVSPEDFERFKKGEMTKEEMLNIKKAVDKVTEAKTKK